ncbi:hypothetical protein Ancab_033175 [Ancistrocladus abbreviatus]
MPYRGEKQRGTAKKGGSQEAQVIPNLVFTSSEKDREWLKECWYREVYSIEDLLGLECRLKEAGVPDCSIQYLGGKGVILVASGRRAINEIFTKHRNQLSRWFATIRPWATTDVGEGQWVAKTV